jgi:hypothetical protein
VTAALERPSSGSSFRRSILFSMSARFGPHSNLGHVPRRRFLQLQISMSLPLAVSVSAVMSPAGLPIAATAGFRSI